MRGQHLVGGPATVDMLSMVPTVGLVTTQGNVRDKGRRKEGRATL